MKNLMNAWINALIIFALSCFDMSAQEFKINNGTTFSLGSATLSLSGNWNNSGTFNAEDGTVIFNAASGDQTITNTNGETFNDLTVNKTDDDLKLLNDITVNGTLKLSSGNLNLNGKVATLGTSADLNETINCRVYGTSGYLKTTRDINNPASLDVAGFGAVLTSSADLGSTVIKRGHADQSGGGNTTTLCYFDIEPTNNSGLDATLVFNYDQSEVNGLTEADMQLVRSTDGGTTWSVAGGTIDGTANTGTLSDIDSFSRWTLAYSASPALADIEGENLGYSENNGAVQISSAITLTDTDDTNIESALVEISNNYQNGEDVLAFTNTANITGTWDVALGRLRLNGTDSKANYQAALREVTYENTSDNPVTSTNDGTEKQSRFITSTPRTVSFSINDGYSQSNIETRIISLSAVNDAPQLENIERNSVKYIAGDGATSLTGTLIISDDDDGYIESAIIQVCENYRKGEDKLLFDDTNGISGSWDRSTGTLTLTGTAKKLYYKNALHSIKYINTKSCPSLATRRISFQVDDGLLNSNILKRKIEIAANSNAPNSPSNVSTSFSSTGGVVVTWEDNSGNENGFNIERETRSSANSSVKDRNTLDYILIGTVAADVNTFTDENVEEGVVYDYRVSAFNDEGSSGVAFGEGGGEVEACAPLYTPTNLTAESNEDGIILLNWNDNSTIEEGYIIFRKTSGDWIELDQVGVDKSEYSDSDVMTDTLYCYCVKAFNTETESQLSNVAESVSMIVGVEIETGMPTDFTLSQNYPNPFNPSTIIEYGLPNESHVQLAIYNTLGQQVAELVNRIESAGVHTLSFDATGLTSGIYFYKIEADSYTEIKKMILLR